MAVSMIQYTYLCSLGSIFTIAFISYYLSYPGLLSSSSGVEPVGRLFPRILPHVFHVDDGDIDTFCEGLLLTGIVVSSILASGLVNHGSLFLLVTVIYSILVKLGSTFYSFQWDILLLEAGFLTSISGYAPWTNMNITRVSNRKNKTNDTKQQQQHGDNLSNPGCSVWPLRFLLFKLMVLSGAVKLQADCPTWQHLTALEYHFATQCLPGPLAWYAHQLPPFLLRLSVALTLWIEIPVAFLLLQPHIYQRRIGATLQIVLQILILLSGNYNFFNLLTIALTLPCIDQPSIFKTNNNEPNETTKHENEETKNNRFKTVFDWLEKEMERYRMAKISCWLILGLTFHGMFRFGMVNHQWSIKLVLSRAKMDDYLESTIPIMILASFLFIIDSSYHQLRQQSCCWVWTVLSTILCIICIGTTAVPMFAYGTIHHGGWEWGYHKLFFPLWNNYLQSHSVSNSYGLFRRMTGVGNPRNFPTKIGHAGLPPSIVQRPELILEGHFVSTKRSYDQPYVRDIQFRWKPGAIDKAPKQVAPHQPRLDWQMWFAALGNYQQNPWLIHFIDQLLQNCSHVNELLDEPELLNGNEKLVQIQAKLYHYDFTRMHPIWWKEASTAPYTTTNDYWTRTMKYDYFPPIKANNPSVESFLSSYGYSPASTCQKVNQRCANNNTTTKWNFFCRQTVAIREYNLFWCPIICLMLFWSWYLFQKYIFRNKATLFNFNKEKIN